ncbi:MAG TPA: efflux RND transporter periplasmic adaptor subunit, partial [Sphingomonas sp.]|nr:efflux RND transporter periplasmic adaptor subunit [Sphingomonas sp.]
MKTIMALAPLALLAACSGGAAEEGEPPAPTATVRTATATLGATSDTVSAYGLAEAGPGGQHALTVQTEARLAEIIAPTGTAVRAGQVVAVLRPTPASQLDVAKANSDAAAANAALARAQRLRADGLVSDADVETARAAA